METPPLGSGVDAESQGRHGFLIEKITCSSWPLVGNEGS